jgi:predicted aminopeptidase
MMVENMQLFDAPQMAADVGILPQRPAAPHFSAFPRVAALLLACLCTSGCGTVRYYTQAIDGHFELLRKRESTAKLLASRELDPALRARLELLSEVRRFAVTALSLPDNDSYTSYADLGRDFVVWNVFAAPELSLELRESCFLFVGCLSYRGFFARDAALGYAADLERRGYDTYVGGVAAYSTLGWFSDPLLSTMLRWETPRLIKVMLHELAHQVVYVKGDTAFNEAFATAVAQQGYRRWLTHAHGSGTHDADVGEAREADLMKLVLSARAALVEIYSSQAPPATKRARKTTVFADLERRYAAWRERWNGYRGYDDFMRRLNNAKIASVVAYHDRVPAFDAILAGVDYDFAAFYRVIQEFRGISRPERDACLDALMAGSIRSVSACPALAANRTVQELLARN